MMMQLLNTKISQIEPKTIEKKMYHYLLRIGIMLLSAISTIILGLKNFIEISTNFVLIFTSLITFMSALAAFWDIETNWIRLKIMLNKLKVLRYEYAFRLQRNSYISKEETESFPKVCFHPS